MKLLLYFADGFSWDYLEQRPFMEEFWDERRRLDTLLGYSSTIMPAILTGAWPRDTGIWTEYYREPRPPSTVQRLLSRPRLRPLGSPVNLARLVWFRIARRTGMGMEHRLRIPIELANQFQRHPIRYDQFPPIGLPVPSLADLFAELGLRVEFRYVKPGEPSGRHMEWLRGVAAFTDVVFFYDPTLDGTGHRVGGSAEALAPQLDQLARFLESAHGALARHGEPVESLLFSDHGMTTVRETFDLFGLLEPFRLGTDYLVFMDSTMARFWFPSEEARRAVLTRLEAAPARLLSSQDKSDLGVDFAQPDMYGHEILVADEGVVLHPNYFAGPFLRFARKYPERAMHGYLPEAPSSAAVYLRRGGARNLPTPTSVKDIFAVVEALVRGAT